MASKLLARAVRAFQLYAGCGHGTMLCNMRDQQRLYTQMRKAAARVAKHYKISETAATHQLAAEAQRRGPLWARPGKDR